jgi:N-acetylmuramoyl-L-alanine amidase
VDKERFVYLRDLAGLYSCDITGPEGRAITLRSRWNTLVFTTEGREVRVNGTLVWLHDRLQLVRGRWAIREVDARYVIDPVIRPELYLQKAGTRVIVLDPGHGGQDTGARGARGVEEKRAVLDIARRVRNQLTSAGYRVYMTREGDRFIELEERCRMARRWGADVFVSIHLNSAGNLSAAGTETYVLAAAGYESTAGGSSTASVPGNRHEAANAILGYQIQRALVGRVGLTDRGVKRSRFVVLKNAPCPAVLVECAFVSNRREEERLLREDFREAIAQGIARGTIQYMNTIRKAKLSAP